MAEHRELTHKEIKMINDLLDGQLPAEKAKQAFLQIEQDTALSAAYNKLRWTKSLLRQAPRRKVPHNFSLTRQMAKEATGFYKLRRQTFSIAGALASFLFVVLLAVQLIPLGMSGMLPIAMKSEDMSMADEAMEPEMMQAVPEAEFMEMPAEEEPVEEEVMAMELPEEELEAEPEETPAFDAAAEAPADEALDSAMATATSSSEQEAFGGEADEEAIEDAEEDMDAIGEAEPSADEDERIFADEEPESTAMEIETLDDGQIGEAEEKIPEDVESENTQPTGDWLFLATVLAGLLAFVFIFISIRDKNRENLRN